VATAEIIVLIQGGCYPPSVAAGESPYSIAADFAKWRVYRALVKRTLEVLNDLEAEKVFSRYAIAGAMAATFYTEPLLTFDLDVFVLLGPSAGGLISLAPVYEALRARGYKKEEECVLIEGIEEAVQQAREVDYEKIPTRVLSPEYLAAICVQTGRDKDRERIRILRDQAKLDVPKLSEILRRYKLDEKWKQWRT
jgi:hypothetical protein